MTTFRVAERQRFTTIDRAAVNDERLSFKAKGLLLWLLDKPDDWRVTSEEIARSAGPDGRDSVRSGLAELEQAGYLRRERVRQEGGTFVTVTSVYESPGQTEDGFSGAGETDVGSADAGESGALMKTDYQKTETEEENPPTPRKADSPLLNADFEEWWLLLRSACKAAGYEPGSKGDALKAWQKLPKDARRMARRSIEVQLRAIRENPGVYAMPNGSKWLNGLRFHDSTPKPKPSLSSSHKGFNKLREMMKESVDG